MAEQGEGGFPFLRDWAADCCLSKAFLDSLAGRKNAGFELYERHMGKATLIDSDLSFSGLSRYGLVGARVMADVQYKLAEPLTEPSHWSVFSQEDVASIGRLAERRIVIYAHDSTGDSAIPQTVSTDFWINKTASDWGSARFWIWHDGRLDVTPTPTTSDHFQDLWELAAFVVTSGGGRKTRLFRLPAEQVSALDARAHVWFGLDRGPAEQVCKHVDDFGGDFLALADSLLGLQDDDNDGEKQVACSLDDFIELDRRRLYSRWSKLAPSGVLLLSHTFCKLRVLSRRNRNDPFALRFRTLVITSQFTPEMSTVDFADHAMPEAKVVCFYGQKFGCLLSDAYRDQAVTFHLDTRGLAQKLLNRSNFSGVPKTLPREQVKTAQEDRKSKKRPHAGDKIVKICQCRVCRTSKKYDENMSRAGPERLCTVPYSLTDILQMLGAYDSNARVMISRLVKLSVAAMDIESQTVTVDLEGPRPGPSVEYPTIGGPILEGHVIKTQRPIMLGHTDCLMRERGETWYDITSNDTPEAVFNMFSRYWLKVSLVKKQAHREKIRVSQQLSELAGKYQEAYSTYARGWLELSTLEREHHHQAALRDLAARRDSGKLSDEQIKNLSDQIDSTYLESEDWALPTFASILKAFYNTVPGILAKRLSALQRRYVVFNFYG